MGKRLSDAYPPHPRHICPAYALLVWLCLTAIGAASDVANGDATQAIPVVSEGHSERVEGGPVAHWDLLHGGVGSHRPLIDYAGSCRDVLSPIGGKPLPGILSLGVHEGDPEYLLAPVSDDLRLGPSYTIEARVLPVKVDGWNRIVMQWGAASNWAYHLAIHNGNASLCHGQSDGTYLTCEGGQVRSGQAYHLVGVARCNEHDASKSTLEVYVNGKRTVVTPFDGTTKRLQNEKLGIGDSASIPSSASRFRGYLAGVTIWGRPLSAEEIRRRADGGEFAEELVDIESEIRERDCQSMANRLAESSALLERLGVQRILFAERAPGRDYQRHYYANFGYSCTDPDYWLHGADGGRLLVLDVKKRGIDVLLNDPHGAIRDPQVDYDGGTILFSYRRGGMHHYNLYEINVDGTNLCQLTSGPWDDVEPTYLPDGGIAFCSTRCKRYIGCWLAPSAILFRCDADGGNIRMLSTGAFTENTPNVLSDGRVLYTRWEYVNRDAVSFHHLWTMNPDGSSPMVFYGNQQPGSVFIDARMVPGTDEIVFIDSPGHGQNEHAGYVATVSASVGPNSRAAMRHLTRAAGYRDPYPISPGFYLAARDNKLLMLAEDGAEYLLLESAHMVHEPSVIQPRQREPVVPGKTDPSKTTGTVVLVNAYAGRNMQGVRPGAIKKLLVLEDLPKPANFHGGGSQPIGHGVTSTLKRIVGTVPVEPDGSAHFTVPAMRSVYFALLDENDRSIKQMRSFVTLQPGESVGCVGCHEPRNSTSGLSKPVLQALTRPASPIAPIDTVADIPDFPRDVQPILDRHCVPCHSPDRPEGGVNLSGDHGPVYSLAYYELLLHWQVKDTQTEPRHGTGRQPGNDPPYTTYSSASALMDKIDGGHYDVKVSPGEETQLRLWIDAGAQYPGTYAAYGTGQIGGCWRSNEPIRVMADNWPETAPAAEAVDRRCGSCHAAEQLPRHVTARIPLDSWGDMLAWTRPLSRYSRHRIFNLSRPERSLILTVALSESSGGLAMQTKLPSDDGEAKAAPKENHLKPPSPVRHPIVFRDADDPDYQRILTHVRAAGEKLADIKRFDMAGFQPNEQYIREMKRYDILPPSQDSKQDAVDPYVTDGRYWESMWHRVNAKR